ncbi:selenocysteine lyase/cysteine desulfurase [Pedobacter cryoconitis]|uniref:aminotransferase class V-fold PLP-dependent enzyme n=1 Tax=Pedobacter cryoconitis TaxID=188932 RepID=UPI00161C70A8|nr:aminotransferase class V-fold PLP-dependent enzyme [Pedobacter cryoconitis]MBB6271226.1 selenocysteine lyase/cysteine desulfurase [Pedobacter cryoconitis]
MHRRELLKTIGILSGSLLISDYAAAQENAASIVLENGKDQLSIREFQKYYKTDQSFTNLENGFFGVMSEPVLNTFIENTRIVNSRLSGFARLDFPKIYRDALILTGTYLKLPSNSFIFTRNATEALNIAIQGYPLAEGDEVVISQFDYDSMVETWEMLQKTKKIKLVYLDIPAHPVSTEQIVQLYKNAVTSKTRIVHLTHINHFTGLILPIKEITAALKPSGVKTILDAAHSFAHIDYSVTDLGADLVAINLHKWFGSPVGTGLLYIKPELISAMNPLFGDVKHEGNSIYKLTHFGTTPFANIMTIQAAMTFQQKIAPAVKQNYLHELKKNWISGVQNLSAVEVLTPIDPQWSCGIGAFRMKNMDAKRVVDKLWADHQILSVVRNLKGGDCIRITPQIYSTVADTERLIRAMAVLNKS